ncbi:hypothetical protein J7I93_03375 [Bacillus sp. ISL-47]|uniref:hypothetical protein n=1 Tax=Bacillus sp. ISL-47 TaxID=2819130 RepID=UPI001BE8023F|nr:hypothetical protein [Bacillus sp. ISL-47]MBT2687220.1 hypothetical protein [Bacillus sp. ISL-47]
MKNTKMLLLLALTVLLAAGGWGYLYITNETYEGMSIIPEKHDDIPLYKGLEPRCDDYVMDGNHWENIYAFYMEELPANGWRLRYKGSALDDHDPANDWAGFMSSWTKDGFEGELSLSAGYFQTENQTEVRFDHYIPPENTPWNIQPASICVYKDPLDQDCTLIKDQNDINEIINFINLEAYDTNRFEHQEKYGTLAFLNESGEDILRISVHYIKENQMLFLQSEKGEKEMKPIPEFFEVTGLEHLME